MRVRLQTPINSRFVPVVESNKSGRLGQLLVPVLEIATVDMYFMEGQKVRLVVEQIGNHDDILALAAQVYERLSVFFR